MDEKLAFNSFELILIVSIVKWYKLILFYFGSNSLASVKLT